MLLSAKFIHHSLIIFQRNTRYWDILKEEGERVRKTHQLYPFVNACFENLPFLQCSSVWNENIDSLVRLLYCFLAESGDSFSRPLQDMKII